MADEDKRGSFLKALETFFGVAGKQKVTGGVASALADEDKRGPFLEAIRAYCTDGPRIINWRTLPLLRARAAAYSTSEPRSPETTVYST